MNRAAHPSAIRCRRPGALAAAGLLGQGFTLVELLLVMSLLTIVLAVSAPSLSGFFHGRALDSEARRLLALTRHAQGRAVSEGIPMLLWLDSRQSAYGVEEEAGYTDRDEQAMHYDMNGELGLEVAAIGPVARASSTTSPATAAAIAARGGTGPLAGEHRNLPTMRFLPDGMLGETSPRAVRVFERQNSGGGSGAGAEIWLVQSSNRLCYEVQSDYRSWN